MLDPGSNMRQLLALSALLLLALLTAADPSSQAQLIPDPSSQAQLIPDPSSQAQLIPDPSSQAQLIPHPSSQAQLIPDPNPLVLNVGSTQIVNLTLAGFIGNFSCSIVDTDVANFTGSAPSGESAGNVSFSAELVGRKFGWTFCICGSGKLQVTVLKPSGVLDVVYRVLIIVLVIAIVFCMGCSVQIRTVLSLIKRPVALSIGWVCQFILMPHLALGVGELLRLAMKDFTDPEALAFGLLTFGCSPGGSSSNTWTYLLDGDLDLSMTMTFFSQICAFFMMPLWLFAYGRLYIDPSQVRIPFDQVAYTLLQSAVPIVLGVLVRMKWPQAGKKISKAIGPLALLFILVVAGLGSYIYLYLLELLWKNPIVIPFTGMLPWLGFLLAFLLSIACRLPRSQAVAIAMECGVQNAGIPIQLLLFSMPKPQGDIASIVPIAATILTPVPLYFAVIGYRIHRRIHRQRAPAVDSLAMTQLDAKDSGSGGVRDDLDGGVRDDLDGGVRDDLDGGVRDDLDGGVRDDLDGGVRDDLDWGVRDDLDGGVRDGDAAELDCDLTDYHL